MSNEELTQPIQELLIHLTNTLDAEALVQVLQSISTEELHELQILVPNPLSTLNAGIVAELARRDAIADEERETAARRRTADEEDRREDDDDNSSSSIGGFGGFFGGGDSGGDSGGGSFGGFGGGDSGGGGADGSW